MMVLDWVSFRDYIGAIGPKLWLTIRFAFA